MPEYLKNTATESQEVFDFRDWGIPLGRRFRALKLWQVINYYGIEGLQEYIKENMINTEKVKSWIEKNSNFEIVAPVPLTLICFRHKKGDDFNRKLLNRMNESGKMYMTHTILKDQSVIRFSIGTATTNLDHLKSTWTCIEKYASELENS